MDAYWYQFIRQTLYEDPACFLSSTGRRYVMDSSLTIPGTEWAKGLSVTLSDLGYQGRSTKMSQLRRIYFNEPGLAAGREKLSGRVSDDMDFTSVSVILQAGEKDSRSQGHCMIAATVTHIPKDMDGKANTTVNLSYRVTESIRKFGADLIFLHKEVLPALIPEELFPLTSVNFRFANAYFSPLFVPVLYQFIDPLEFLQELESRIDMTSRNKNIFKSCCRAIKLPLIEDDPSHYNYRARRMMHGLALNNMKDIDTTKLMKYLKEKGEI